jgi:2-methylcitrate dehydratase PrpD
VTAPQGEATNPLSWEALDAKFRAATRMVATDAQQNQLLSAINDTRAGDQSALTACLEGLTFHRSN